MGTCRTLVTSVVHPAGFTMALSIPLVVAFFVAAKSRRPAQPPTSTGHVLVVGPGNFSTIQDAVDQAADGDSILVKAGSYAGFSIVNKDLRVFADQGSVVNVLGHVSVNRLAASKVVVLAGLGISRQNGFVALTTYQDSGALRLQQCSIRGFQASGYGTAGVEIEGSSNVCLSSCVVQAGNGAWGGPRGIEASGSTVAIYDSNLRGGAGGYGDCDGGPGGPGGAAYEQTETNPSFVFLSGSSLFGGTGGMGGYYACDDCNDYGSAGGVGGDGGPCVQQFGSFQNPVSVGTLNLGLSPGQGGPGGEGCSLGICCLGQPNGAPGSNGPQFQIPGQQLQQLSGSSRRFLTPRVARANATATLSCYGLPGDAYQVFLSSALEFTYLPNLHGVRLAQVSSAQLVASGAVPSSGLFAPTITLPPLRGADSRPLYLQAYVRDSSGQRFLCAQMTLLEVDPRF